MSFRILQLRRDSASNWTAANPTLADGEIVWEESTNLFKIGDGSTAWTSLLYLKASATHNGFLTSTDWSTFNSKASASRNINTTSPLSGGGDLSADRTLTIADFIASGASHARGAVPDPGVTAGALKYLREDASWTQPALADIGSVTLVSPTAGAVLTFNGSAWVNAPNAPTVGGASLPFYFNSSPIGTGGLSSLLTDPSGVAETDLSVTVGPGTTDTALIQGYASVATVPTTVIPAGEWLFDLFTYTSNVTGSNVLVCSVCRDFLGAGTMTITGTGTSRTATATGGTPFLSGDANADMKLAGRVGTPTQTFQITGFTSSSVVTIATPSGYVNESSIAYNMNRWLFNTTTPDISSTTTVEYAVATVQPSFTGFGAADFISIFVFASHPGSGNHTIHILEDGITHYSHVHTPIAIPHNELSGLQGGTTNQYYHLTSAEHTVATTAATTSVPGFLTAADWTTFNNKVSTSRTINTTSPLAGGGDLSADRTFTIANAAADGTTKGAAAFTAADFNATSGVVSIDYTNGQKATASVPGFLTAADWTTFNNKHSVISANQTFYVRTDGNDTHDGSANTAGAAFLTIQHACNVVAGLYIAGGVVVTIQIADGTYNEAVILPNLPSGGTCLIQGNTGTPANVIVQGGAGAAFTTGTFSQWTISGMEIRSTSLYGINAQSGSILVGSSIRFGVCGNHQCVSQFGGIITFTASYSIVGAAPTHITALWGGQINLFFGATVTVSGTPAFSQGFCICQTGSTVFAWSQTYSGSATGKRYSAVGNGVIDTNAGGANYFPGNVAGTTATGGQYI